MDHVYYTKLLITIKLALLHSTSYIFFLYHSQSSSCCVVEVSINIDQVHRHQTSANIVACVDFNANKYWLSILMTLLLLPYFVMILLSQHFTEIKMNILTYFFAPILINVLSLPNHLLCIDFVVTSTHERTLHYLQIQQS